jgi:SSS family solute:Na+ symporter
MTTGSEALLLGPGARAAVVLYLGALVVIGVFSRRARTETSLADFYLAGRGLGVVVLFLTLYATQYSGLTLVGFAGNFYRRGFAFLGVVSFAAAIGSVYLWYAPRLHVLSKQRGYVTVGD